MNETLYIISNNDYELLGPFTQSEIEEELAGMDGLEDVEVFKLLPQEYTITAKLVLETQEQETPNERK